MPEEQTADRKRRYEWGVGDLQFSEGGRRVVWPAVTTKAGDSSPAKSKGRSKSKRAKFRKLRDELLGGK